MIADTSGLIAAADTSHAVHAGARRALESLRGTLKVPPTVLVEYHFLLRRHRVPEAFGALLESIADGSVALTPIGSSDVSRAGEVLAEYASLDLDFTDATLVAIAEREKDFDLLTLDERDFRAIRPRGRSAFRLFPADG